MGIWPTYSDGGDVNACDRSPSGKYLLTADNFGKVGRRYFYRCSKLSLDEGTDMCYLFSKKPLLLGKEAKFDMLISYSLLVNYI